MKARRPAPALTVLMTLFAVSLGLRAAITAERAAAYEKPMVEEADSTSECTGPQMPAALAEALSQREAAVLEKETALAEQVAALEKSKTALEEKLAEMLEAETALSATLSMSNAAAETDLSRLTAVYEQMKPADAAALFSTMDPDFAAGFIGRLSPQIAAGIMTGIDPELAYTISVIMAGRNAKAPSE